MNKLQLKVLSQRRELKRLNKALMLQTHMLRAAHVGKERDRLKIMNLERYGRAFVHTT
ncbi:MAG: hypothetical protein QQN63_09265 [Nitrosopumilus sp.]